MLTFRVLTLRKNILYLMFGPGLKIFPSIETMTKKQVVSLLVLIRLFLSSPVSRQRKKTKETKRDSRTEERRRVN